MSGKIYIEKKTFRKVQKELIQSLGKWGGPKAQGERGRKFNSAPKKKTNYT